MNAPSPARVQALLRLLSDPDEQIAQTIQEELVKMGHSVLPFLETTQAEDDILAPRLAWVVEEIFFPQLLENFSQSVRHGSPDWEHGAFLIAQLRHPTLSIPHYQCLLDQFAEEFRARWNLPSLSVVEKARYLAIFLFKDKGFSGNQEYYYDPDNSFMHQVIDRRRGIPITLSALYMFVGTRVGLPVAGVGMPGHFLVRLLEVEPPQYVDAFNGGALLKEQDCRQFIEAAGLDFHPQYLENSAPHAILSRMLRNLLNIYEEAGQATMIRRAKALLDCLEIRS